MYRQIAVLLTLAMVGCAGSKGVRSPSFYPNEKYRTVLAADLNGDTRYCMSLADDYVKDSGAYKAVAKRTAIGAVTGSAAGAVAGTIVGGNVGRAVGAGAAAGAVVSLLNGLFSAGESNPSWERFVEHCLADKGYQIHGWE